MKRIKIYILVGRKEDCFKLEKNAYVLDEKTSVYCDKNIYIFNDNLTGLMIRSYSKRYVKNMTSAIEVFNNDSRLQQALYNERNNNDYLDKINIFNNAPIKEINKYE